MRQIEIGWVTALLAAMQLSCVAADMMSVQVREGAVRTSPSFLSKVEVTLAYGERITITEKKAPWAKVMTSAGVTGWMHESALTTKRIAMAAGKGDVDTGASSEDLALAGKGFNSDVEAQFKARNSKANFAAVDRMERHRVESAAVAKFLSEGGVAATVVKGGAK